MEDHKHIDGAPLDYNYIDDGIYVGTNQCCQTGLADVLKKEGISADISLEEERLDQPFGVDMYLWLPTVDHMPPSFDQLEVGVDAIKKLVAQKRKIYVHCKNGHGRAPTFVSAYLISKGMDANSAISFIQSKRSSTHILDNQKAALEKFLLKYSQS